jgi:N5-hydroxy-L-ornithine N5-transacylase
MAKLGPASHISYRLDLVTDHLSNSVNIGWRERGPDEKHRAYLADRLADPHIMGFVVKWNGQLAGYGEMAWVKEDPMGTYVGGLGDYDQGRSDYCWS